MKSRTCNALRMIGMRIGFIILVAAFVRMQGNAQENMDSSFLVGQEAAAKAWLDNLYTHGVQIKGDSVYFNDETRLITTDSMYRKLIYPETYSWEVVSALMQRNALKQAIWYMINLYHKDPMRQDLVMNMILPLDQTLQMERVMLATFYTYIAFDPEVYRIENGRTVEVLRPDIAEHKLLATKAIVDQIFEQRRLQASRVE